MSSFYTDLGAYIASDKFKKEVNHCIAGVILTLLAVGAVMGGVIAMLVMHFLHK